MNKKIIIIAIVLAAVYFTQSLTASESSRTGTGKSTSTGTGTADELLPLLPKRGVFAFDFESDGNHDEKPDWWVRVYDKDNLPRVRSELQLVNGSDSKALVFRLSHAPALIETRRRLKIDQRVTYLLQGWIKATGLKHTSAHIEVVFYTRFNALLSEYTVRTEKIDGDTGRFRKVTAVIDKLPKNAIYARIRCVLSGPDVFEDGETKARPDKLVRCAFDNIILREFPRTFVTGRTIYFVNEEALVTATTSSLKAGSYRTLKDTFDYRQNPIEHLGIRSEFVRNNRTPHVAESRLFTGKAGFYVFHYTITDSKGKMITMSEMPYVVLKKYPVVQSPDFGTGVDPSLDPVRISELLQHIGVGMIMFDLPSGLAEKARKDLEQFSMMPMPGIEKVGTVSVPTELVGSGERARKRLKMLVDDLGKHATRYADELVQWLLYPEDSSLLARTSLKIKPLLSALTSPIRAVKRASRVGLVVPQGDPPSSLPVDEVNLFAREVSCTDNLSGLTPGTTGSRWAIAILPAYDPAKHHERISSLARSMLKLKQAGFERIFTKFLTDKEYGLLGSSGELRPSFLAYRTLVKLLDNATLVPLMDPGTGRHYRVHDRATTLIFRMKRGIDDTEDKFLLAAWVDSGEEEIDVHLGNELRIHGLLGESRDITLRAEQVHLSLSRTPVLVSGINMALLRFILNIKFETQMSCRQAPQKVVFSFKNYFDKPFDCRFQLYFPPEWAANPTTFTFEGMLPGELKNATMEVSIPLEATIATKLIKFDINIFELQEDGKPAKRPTHNLSVLRPLSLKSRITASISLVAGQHGSHPQLRIKVVNATDSPLEMYAYVNIEGRPPPPEEYLVALSKKGETGDHKEIFVRLGSEVPHGKKVRLGLREKSGTSFYNTEFIIPKAR